MRNEDIARICHEANRAYCITLNDTSQLPWDEAPQWAKDSALMGVNAILVGITKKPSDSHESWLKQKKEDGWKYGPIKDPEKKEHPCYVPYAELPFEQQTKDYIFFAIASTLITR